MFFDECNCLLWRDSDGKFHRDGRPAVIEFEIGREWHEYFVHGIFQRGEYFYPDRPPKKRFWCF